MSKTLLLIAVLLIASMLSTIVPVHAWLYPDPAIWEDYKFEKFGPRLDRIHIPMFESETAEWDAMEKGYVDLTDWPLTYARYISWAAKPEIRTVSYGPEPVCYAIIINCDNNTEKAYPDPDPTKIDYPNPLPLPNPCADVRFRHALWHAMDRDYVVNSIFRGMAIPQTTILPCLHPVPPGIDTHPYNITEANRILDEAGYVDTDGDGWRNMPCDGNIVLIFYGRSDNVLMRELAEWYTIILETELHIQVDLRLADRRTCYYDVMRSKAFHLYTGAIGGRLPDCLVSYQSCYYWHPESCPNYGRINCSALDEAIQHVIEANTWDEAEEWAATAAKIFNDPTCPCALGTIPICSPSGYKAWYKTYTGGYAKPAEESIYIGKNWTHIVNVPGYGPDSFFTFLNVHPEGYEYGVPDHPMTIRYGFKVLTIEKPANPVYAEWVWEWAVIGLIYESLLTRDPYTFEWMPWLCKKYEVFTWVDPADGMTKSGVRFVLRDDVYWSDGTPMIAADVFWTLVEMVDELKAAGLPPPWWCSNVAHVKSMYMTDPYNIEILLDVKSVWAVGWLGGTIILPKHVWKPLIECYKAGKEYRPGYVPRDFEAAYVDPDVIATGPYRFVEYKGGNYTLLVANKPGSTVQTSWTGSVPVTSPGYYRYYPVQASIDVVSPGVAYRHRMDKGAWTVNATIENLCQTENITATLKVTYMKPDGATTFSGYTVTVPAAGRVSITLPADFTIYGKHVFTYTLDYKALGRTWHYESGPKVFWITIAQDIVGSTYYDDIGLPEYPYKKALPTPNFKVDMRDVCTAARAFGSYPGHPSWSQWGAFSDLDHNYKVDMKDIVAIARKFGWTDKP